MRGPEHDIPAALGWDSSSICITRCAKTLRAQLCSSADIDDGSLHSRRAVERWAFPRVVLPVLVIRYVGGTTTSLVDSGSVTVKTQAKFLTRLTCQ